MDITVNIIEFDENYDTFIVSFSDGVRRTQPVAYQPYNFDTNDINEMLKIMAQGGMHMLNDLRKQEEYKKSNTLKNSFKALANTFHTFSISEINNTQLVVNEELEVKI